MYFIKRFCTPVHIDLHFNCTLNYHSYYKYRIPFSNLFNEPGLFLFHFLSNYSACSTHQNSDKFCYIAHWADCLMKFTVVYTCLLSQCYEINLNKSCVISPLVYFVYNFFNSANDDISVTMPSGHTALFIVHFWSLLLSLQISIFLTSIFLCNVCCHLLSRKVYNVFVLSLIYLFVL